MAKFIKTISDRINFAIKKGLTGYVSPTKLMEEVHAESMNLWKKYVDEFERTTKMNLFLSPFEKIEAVTGLTGSASEGSLDTVNAYRYPTSVSLAGNIDVPVLTQAEYNNRYNHPTKFPDATHPICKFVGKKIYVAPKSDVTIYYLSKPVKPVYATTVVPGDQYAYDDANSTDIEWDETLHDDIMNRVLANLGLAMREGQVVQFSQTEKVQEGK
jgi:hypothetical protein